MQATHAQPTSPIHKEDTESFLRSIGYWSARTCYVEVTNELDNLRPGIRNHEYYTRLRNQRYYFRAKMREIADAHRCVICNRWFGTHWLRPVQGPHMHGTTNVTKQRVCVHCLDPRRPMYWQIHRAFSRCYGRTSKWRKTESILYFMLLRTPRIIHEWTFDDDILNRRGGN